MKNRTLILLILGFLLAKSASAQSGSTSAEMVGPELFQAFGSVISLTGYPAQDAAWPGYRLLDANGIMRVLSDVTGPAAPLEQYSTASQLVWAGMPGGDANNFRIQTRYADFGATCDLNNPNHVTDSNTVIHLSPPPNYGNALSQTYQSGPYNSCGGNAQFSQNNFSPIPLTTRSAWMYRTCRRIGAGASSAQITMMVERLRVPDPTPTPVPGPGVGVISVVDPTRIDGSNPQNPALTYNWCNRISQPVEADYQAVFRAFYPGRTIPQIIDPTRSQYQQGPASASDSKRRPVSPSAFLWSLGIPTASAQISLPIGGTQTAPQFREHLMELVAQSNAYIDTLPSVGNQRWQVFEDRCLPVQNAPQPSKDQVKALAAWRALFITMCLDPGWQVL